MIRDAVEADIPRLLEMGERFAVTARLNEHVGYDRDSLERTLLHLIRSESGIVLIGESGCAGGMVHPHPFNLSTLVGQELFWWSEGREGAALFDALEARARALGATFWTMITLEAARPDAVGRLYERRGYRPIERSYMKRL